MDGIQKFSAFVLGVLAFCFAMFKADLKKVR